jgi:hypothetical protein
METDAITKGPPKGRPPKGKRWDPEKGEYRSKPKPPGRFGQFRTPPVPAPAPPPTTALVAKKPPYVPPVAAPSAKIETDAPTKTCWDPEKGEWKNVVSSRRAAKLPTYVPPVAGPPAKTDAPETEVEAGYKMAKISGYLHFSNEHRADVTTLVNAMEGLAPRERQQKVMTELGKMWKALPDADRVSWKECAPVWKSTRTRCKFDFRTGARRSSSRRSRPRSRRRSAKSTASARSSPSSRGKTSGSRRRPS